MRREFVIGYDISHPKRLTKAYRTVINHATPIEYSVFVLHGTIHDARCCMKALEQIINPKEDDLRCYPLPSRGLQLRLGRTSLPEGIIWTGLPSGAVLII